MLGELDRRDRDAEQFIRPQREHGDILISLKKHSSDPAHLDAEVVLRDSLPHPDLSPLLGPPDEPSMTRRAHDLVLRIPGDIDPAYAADLEGAVWDRMSFANHLRVRRLGELTVGTDLYRSDSLALVQLLVLYQLMWVRHEQVPGGAEVRTLPRRASGDDSALLL
ncbi:MAG: hypothetical protein WBP81_36335 [Solirubrobacteraceae bacterium]